MEDVKNVETGNPQEPAMLNGGSEMTQQAVSMIPQVVNGVVTYYPVRTYCEPHEIVRADSE